MITLTVAVLTGAVILGLAVSIWYLRGVGLVGLPPRWLAWLHGAVGLTGAGLLLLTTRGPLRGAGVGVAGFGVGALALLAAAAVAGVTAPILGRRSGNLGAALVATHAGLAVAGYVLFLAWVATG